MCQRSDYACAKVNKTYVVCLFSGHFRDLATKNEIVSFWPEGNGHFAAKHNKGEDIAVLLSG